MSFQRSKTRQNTDIQKLSHLATAITISHFVPCERVEAGEGQEGFMPHNFDRGPTGPWEAVFDRAPLDFYQRNARFRTEFCPVYYRGRLDGSARVLVIGQDPSTDEILAQRILVGEAGQLIQGLLRKLGIRRSYAMFNTFLYGIKGQFDTTMRNLSASNPILAYRNEILDKVAAGNGIEAVIAFGNAAHHAVAKWPGSSNLNVLELLHPAGVGIVGAGGIGLAGAGDGGVGKGTVGPDSPGGSGMTLPI